MTTRGTFRRGQRLPTVLGNESQRRELVVSLAIVAALQVALAAALVVSALQTYRMWRQGVPYIPGEIARVVPVFILLGALIAVFAATRTLRRVRAIQRAPIAPAAGE
jgi:hypothetical protein